MARMLLPQILGLFALTGIAEVFGCWLVLQTVAGRIAWWWGGPAAAASLAVFAWLLTLHPMASGRVYAAYGGVYVLVSLLWLVGVDRARPTAWDGLGVVLCVAGTVVICMQPKP